MTARVVYVAGPMTGIKGYNYPAFNAAAARLREAGYTVLNPVDSEQLNPTPGQHQDWRWYMRQALGMVLNAHGIATLPGWPASRGASLEVHVARNLGLPVAPVHQWEAWAEVNKRAAAERAS